MGQDRIPMTADPDELQATMSAFQGLTDAQRDNFLRNVVEVVLTYKASGGDTAVLVQFADDLLVTARLRTTMPAYRTAFAS